MEINLLNGARNIRFGKKAFSLQMMSFRYLKFIHTTMMLSKSEKCEIGILEMVFSN